MSLTKTEMNAVTKIMMAQDKAGMDQFVEIFNNCRKLQNSNASVAYTIGQRVYFNNKKQGRIEGVIVKKLRTNIQVKTDNGIWRVSPAAIAGVM